MNSPRGLKIGVCMGKYHAQYLYFMTINIDYFKDLIVSFLSTLCDFFLFSKIIHNSSNKSVYKRYKLTPADTPQTLIKNQQTPNDTCRHCTDTHR